MDWRCYTIISNKKRRIPENTFTAENLKKNILLIPAAVLVLLTFNRLFYGTELTDEAFYVAIPLGFINGMRPFAENWDTVQTSAFFLTPFLYVYRLVTGGTEGVFLFSRMIYFVFTVFVATVGYFSIRKYVNSIVAVYIALILVTYAPFSLFNASYNHLTFTFLVLGLFLLINAFSLEYEDEFDEKKQRRKRLLIFAAGISHAFMTFFYPSVIILCAFIGLFVIPRVIFKTSGSSEIFRLGKFYLLGGISMGIVLFCILLVASGGVGGILSGINGILQAPFYGTNINYWLIISEIPIYVHGALKLQNLDFLIYLIILGFFLLKKAGRKISYLYLSLALIPLVIFVYQWYLLGVRDSMSQILFMFFAGGIMPVCLYFLTYDYKDMFSRLFILLYFPSFFGFLVISNSSAGMYLQAPWIMVGGCILSAIFISYLIVESKFKRAILPIQVIACLLFSVCNVFMHYNIFYRDDQIDALNYKIEHGVYRGIRTTKQRKLLLENTETLIKSIDQEGRTVMAMENVPFAYLMSDMTPLTPSLWAPTGYWLSMNDCTQIFAYYNHVGRMPDFIFLFDPSANLYGHDPDYELHTWLWENYVLSADFTDKENILPFFLFEQK